MSGAASLISASVGRRFSANWCVQAQTAAQRPVVCRIEGGGVGHFICLAGWWIGPDAVIWLLVHDLRYGAVGQPVSASYVRYDVVASRYPMGAAYGHNDYSYAVG